jgi:cytoskeletal protein RodZ
MPGTPPIIEPLEMHERAPDTQRDASLAVRAERRRWLTLGMVSAVIAAVAIGGYFAGKRERVLPPPETTATTATATATATTATTATATTTSTPSASAAAPAVAPSALPSASPSGQPSAVTPDPGKVHRRLRRAPAPADSAAEKPELAAPPVPENPFDP